MSELVTTTLPISVRTSPMLRTTITPINAGFIARGLGSDLELWHGIHGVAGHEFDTSDLDEIYTDFSGEQLDTNRDDSACYKNFMTDIIAELVDVGFVGCQDRHTLNCGCGNVSIDQQAFDETPIKKLKLIEEGEHGPQCVHCQELLLPEASQRLVLRPGFAAKDFTASIAPAYTAKKTNEMSHQLNSRTQIISKNKPGDHYPKVTVEGTEFAVDPDFWMLGTPLFSGQNREQVTLVAGAEQQLRIFNAIALWAKFRDPDNLRGVLHPKLQFKGSVANIAGMTTHEFLECYGSSDIARLIVAKGLNWKSHNSTVTDDAVSTAKKTAINTRAIGLSSAPYESPEKLIEAINPNAINKALKDIRRGQFDDASAQLNAYAILGERNVQ